VIGGYEKLRRLSYGCVARGRVVFRRFGVVFRRFRGVVSWIISVVTEAEFNTWKSRYSRLG
jgi:hypothetical protein